jgi:hypothetical protein
VVDADLVVEAILDSEEARATLLRESKSQLVEPEAQIPSAGILPQIDENSDVELCRPVSPAVFELTSWVLENESSRATEFVYCFRMNGGNRDVQTTT